VNRDRAPGVDRRRIAPVLLAGVLAAAYVIASPGSGDLPAHLLRAKLFDAEGFGVWSNWWYGGQPVVLYSVLFPPVEAALTPQLAAAIAVTGTAALFEPLAHRHFGERAWLGSLWFAAGAATSLYTGRLAFAFGMLPAVATALALQRRRAWLAAALAIVTALSSPVAAVFAALAGAAAAIPALSAERRIRPALPGLGVVAAALIPIALLAIAFPEGGTEPYAFSAVWPLPLVAIGLAVLMPRSERVLFAAAVLYAIGVIVSYAVPSALGSNAGRLGELVAGPLAALLLWPRRKTLLLVVAVPLVYLQWHSPVGTVATVTGSSTTNAYYRPLMSFLERQGGPPFRVEIPFTKFHWETYAVAPEVPLARGWERQLDIKYNRLFYDGVLTPARYELWLHTMAVRFVALADAPLDYSARAERVLIEDGLPYLKLVWRSRHWRVYAVANPSPIVQGAATLRALGPNSISLAAARAGTALVRVHFTPYWSITEGSGCVAPAGQFTRLSLRRAGAVRMTISFAPGRIGAHSPRCSPR
jgi:hypothetical protein